jgi:hypothetical protein
VIVVIPSTPRNSYSDQRTLRIEVQLRDLGAYLLEETQPTTLVNEAISACQTASLIFQSSA